MGMKRSVRLPGSRSSLPRDTTSTCPGGVGDGLGVECGGVGGLRTPWLLLLASQSPDVILLGAACCHPKVAKLHPE